MPGPTLGIVVRLMPLASISVICIGDAWMARAAFRYDRILKGFARLNSKAFARIKSVSAISAFRMLRVTGAHIFGSNRGINPYIHELDPGVRARTECPWGLWDWSPDAAWWPV